MFWRLFYAGLRKKHLRDVISSYVKNIKFFYNKIEIFEILN